MTFLDLRNQKLKKIIEGPKFKCERIFGDDLFIL